MGHVFTNCVSLYSPPHSTQRVSSCKKEGARSVISPNLMLGEHICASFCAIFSVQYYVIEWD